MHLSQKINNPFGLPSIFFHLIIFHANRNQQCMKTVWKDWKQFCSFKFDCQLQKRCQLRHDVMKVTAPLTRSYGKEFETRLYGKRSLLGFFPDRLLWILWPAVNLPILFMILRMHTAYRLLMPDDQRKGTYR